MAKAKTPIFDEAKWDTLRQIDNYPFDLQIDKETLLAIQQLTKLSLNPDYPDEGQKIEIER